MPKTDHITPPITLPVRIEPSAVYHEIVDAEDRLICFMAMSEVAYKRAEMIVRALNGEQEAKCQNQPTT